MLERRANPGPDGGDDKTVTILNRVVTRVCLLGSREADRREILLAQIELDGANVKSETTPAVKVQEWTLPALTKLDRDRTSTFRSATMRASYMSINRLDVQQAVKEAGTPSEGVWSVLKRLISILCGSRHARAGNFRTEVREGAARVDIDSDCARTRKSTTCAHLFYGVNLITARILDARHSKF